MKSIAFIIVWLGPLPNYFPFWLVSCKWNPTIDFFVFTDDAYTEPVPDNVSLIPITMEDVRARLQKIFDFPIALPHPYKLCDYKPAYGEAFSDYVGGYEYWGYCDMDLIWGNIRNFLPDDVLESYDRIFTRGHCSLFRNVPTVNRYYRTLPHGDHLDYEMVYSSDQSWCFDEWAEHCGGGISVIYKENHIPTYDCPVMADIQYGCGSFFINGRNDLGKIAFFRFFRGTLSAVTKKGGDQFLYCHFQKRAISIQGSPDMDAFRLFPYGTIAADSHSHPPIKSMVQVIYLDTRALLRRLKERARLHSSTCSI
jgi:hypothetical protein